jgi:hypothetical protein
LCRYRFSICYEEKLNLSVWYLTIPLAVSPCFHIQFKGTLITIRDVYFAFPHTLYPSLSSSPIFQPKIYPNLKPRTCRWCNAKVSYTESFFCAHETRWNSGNVSDLYSEGNGIGSRMYHQLYLQKLFVTFYNPHMPTVHHNVTIYVCDYRRGVDWILDLLTPLGTTSNYNTIADLHTL